MAINKLKGNYANRRVITILFWDKNIIHKQKITPYFPNCFNTPYIFTKEKNLLTLIKNDNIKNIKLNENDNNTVLSNFFLRVKPEKLDIKSFYAFGDVLKNNEYSTGTYDTFLIEN